MIKITAIVSLVLIGAFWAAGMSGLSCDSCGRECAASCGTRHFRTCCFNYLRKKRGSQLADGFKQMSTRNHEDVKQSRRFPLMSIDNTPDSPINSIYSTNDLDPNFNDDVDVHFQVLYDA